MRKIEEIVQEMASRMTPEEEKKAMKTRDEYLGKLDELPVVEQRMIKMLYVLADENPALAVHMIVEQVHHLSTDNHRMKEDIRKLTALVGDLS